MATFQDIPDDIVALIASFDKRSNWLLSQTSKKYYRITQRDRVWYQLWCHTHRYEEYRDSSPFISLYRKRCRLMTFISLVNTRLRRESIFLYDLDDMTSKCILGIETLMMKYFLYDTINTISLLNHQAQHEDYLLIDLLEVFVWLFIKKNNIIGDNQLESLFSVISQDSFQLCECRTRLIVRKKPSRSIVPCKMIDYKERMIAIVKELLPKYQGNGEFYWKCLIASLNEIDNSSYIQRVNANSSILITHLCIIDDLRSAKKLLDNDVQVPSGHSLKNYYEMIGQERGTYNLGAIKLLQQYGYNPSLSDLFFLCSKEVDIVAGFIENRERSELREIVKYMLKQPIINIQSLRYILNRIGRSSFSDSIPLLVERGNIDVIKLLVSYGTSLERFIDDIVESIIVWAKNPDLIQYLVDRGFDINYSDFKDNTFLHNVDTSVIIANGTRISRYPHHPSYDEVRKVIELGFDVNAINADGESVLYRALKREWVGRSDDRIISLLLDSGAITHLYKERQLLLYLKNSTEHDHEIIRRLVDKDTINYRIQDGSSPLNYARSMDTIKLLISLGADIGSSINNLKHRLMEAESGKIAKSLIDRDDITSSINGDGITSIERYLISLIPKNEEATAQLIRAVSSEDSHTPIGLIISYIADGADINGMTAYGCSILFSSLVSRKMMLASNLITLGAAVDDDCIITSLLGEEKRELSAADDNILVIQAIINVGVDINIISNGSSTLVMILSMEQPTNYRMVELLLDNGVDPNLPSSNGSTPLCLALIRNDIENTIIRLLLEYGADPNVRCNGSTPLSLALISTSRWRDEIIEDLLSYGADPNAKCNEMTPLFLFLIHSNNHGIIKELVRYGADVNEKCNGLSPLGALVSIGDEELETIELLIKLGARVNDRIVTSTLPELDHEVDTISILELAQNNISATNVARLLMKYGAK